MPTLNFPSRADRRRILEELRRLEEEQGKDFTGKELYEAYKQAFLALDQRMEPLCQLDGEGLPPDLTARDKAELSQLMLQAGTAGERYLTAWQFAHPGEDLSQGLPGMVQQLQQLMNKDYDALSLYDPAKPQTLAEIQENARTKTIDLRDRKLKTLGNMQNSRMLMTLHDANGKPRTGVFTKATHVRVKGKLQRILERAKAQCGPEGAAALDGLIDKARLFYHSIDTLTREGVAFPEDASDELTIGVLLNNLRNKASEDGEELPTKSIIKAHLREMNVSFKFISDKALKTLANGLAEMAGDPSNEINAYNLQLRDGQRLDSRNSAMSAVADLLGVGDSVARSDNMRFIDNKGKLVEGSFMDFGKGLDLYAHPEDAVFVNNDPIYHSATRIKLLKSIADLQILDHICMNADRHRGNLMYRVDKDGNFIGVQGIDNDSSFGARGHKPRDIRKLKVVSKSMADRLENMTPEMLKFSLRGRGLSELELRKAAVRLQELKDAIKQGVIQTLTDDKFAGDLSQFIDDKGNGNLFYQVLDHVYDVTQYRKRKRLPFRSLPGEEPPKMAKVPITERKYTVAGLADAAERVGRLLENRETGFRVKDLTGIRGTSDNFKAMVAAARSVENLPRHLGRLNQLDPSLLLRDEAAGESKEAFDEAFRTLRTAANQYLNGKAEQRRAASVETLRGKNPYEQARIDYARRLLKAAELYDELRKGPQTEAEKAEEQSLADRRAIEARRAAQKQGQNMQPQPRQPGPIPQAAQEGS